MPGVVSIRDRVMEVRGRLTVVIEGDGLVLKAGFGLIDVSSPAIRLQPRTMVINSASPS
jgi:hypothetical protein